jgi:hypothetical protein
MTHRIEQSNPSETPTCVFCGAWNSDSGCPAFKGEDMSGSLGVTIKWSHEDVQSLYPMLSDEDAEIALQSIGDTLSSRSIEVGWEVMEQLLNGNIVIEKPPTMGIAIRWVNNPEDVAPQVETFALFVNGFNDWSDAAQGIYHEAIGDDEIFYYLTAEEWATIDVGFTNGEWMVVLPEDPEDTDIPRKAQA